ncbi:MAG: hypothetical protein ACUVQ1_06375 [Candidatus Kapaibacteriales bacterium]
MNNNKHIFTLTIIIFAFILFSFRTNQNEGLSILKSTEGFLFVFNHQSESILFEVIGKDFHEVEAEELIFSIDGQIFQFVLVPINEFYNPAKTTDTLLQYYNFESNYIKMTYKNMDMHFNKKILTTGNNRRFLLWDFDPIVPGSDKDSNTIIKHIIASYSTPKKILTITSPITRSGNIKEVNNKIFHIITTLCVNSNFYDLKYLQDSLRSNHNFYEK